MKESTNTFQLWQLFNAVYATCFGRTRPSSGTRIYKNIEEIMYKTVNFISQILHSFTRMCKV